MSDVEIHKKIKCFIAAEDLDERDYEIEIGSREEVAVEVEVIISDCDSANDFEIFNNWNWIWVGQSYMDKSSDGNDIQLRKITNIKEKMEIDVQRK